jgi:NAD(P)H-hydrate repair Nnr-like enzyme with NAD(P)H-hydrate epimerase domain
MDIPILAMNDVPYVTTEQMIEVDRAMMEDYQTVPVLSLDAPSGVDTTSGTVFDRPSGPLPP